MRGHSDAQIPFNQLCDLLESLGFIRVVQGTRNLFYRDDVEEPLDLQATRGELAKDYQVKKVRQLLSQYRISL